MAGGGAGRGHRLVRGVAQESRGEGPSLHGVLLRGCGDIAQAQLVARTQHDPVPPYEVGPVVDANGVRWRARPADQVRAGPDHALFGPGERTPEPTVEEYREITGGDHP